MNYRRRLQYFLVKYAHISNKEAAAHIHNGNVMVDGAVVRDSVFLTPYSHVIFNGRLISAAHTFRYIAFYKPRGIECTFNPQVPGNLYACLEQIMLAEQLHGFYYAGRLDKASEGLLLLTNDGNICNRIINPAAHVEKTYEVHLEKAYSSSFVEAMQSGVAILNTITLPCRVEPVNTFCFKITLTQGLNRQIRRMCFALGNYVVKLKRLAIGEVQLGSLQASEYRHLTPDEEHYLKNL